MRTRKFLCFITTVVISIIALSSNAVAYYDGSISYSNADRTKIGSFTYILKENVQYGDKIKIPYSATVVGIPNIKKVEIPEKISYDGLEFLVTDIDLCGELFVHPSKPNIYPNVEEVVLPDSIYNITEFAYFPKITKVNIPKKTAIGRYYSEGFINYDYNNNKYIVDKTIYYSELGSTKVVFDDFFLSDQYGYFSYCCPNLKLSVNPDNPYYSYKNDMLLSKDGKEVFLSLNHNTNITIPDKVERISDYGGLGFYHVKKVKLPDTLKCLGGTWNSITKITLPKDLNEIRYSAFSNSKIKNITLPNGIKKIYTHSFYGSSLKTIKFGKNLTCIGNSAFRMCKKLSKVTINNKIKAPKIKKNAFTGTKKGLKFYVKNKKVAKSLKKQLKGSGVRKAKIYVGKTLVYKNVK